MKHKKIKVGVITCIILFAMPSNVYAKPDAPQLIIEEFLELLDEAVKNDLDNAIEEIGGQDDPSEIDSTSIEPEYLSDTETPLEYLGQFKISHYCCEPYKHICGDGKGLTRTGVPVHPGLISVDPNVIPLGSTVVIDGAEYQAEDTGGMIKGHKIDMAVETHEEALELGVYWADVYVVKK